MKQKFNINLKIIKNMNLELINKKILYQFKQKNKKFKTNQQFIKSHYN